MKFESKFEWISFSVYGGIPELYHNYCDPEQLSHRVENFRCTFCKKRVPLKEAAQLVLDQMDQKV
jgi:hypothetical protein